MILFPVVDQAKVWPQARLGANFNGLIEVTRWVKKKDVS